MDQTDNVIAYKRSDEKLKLRLEKLSMQSGIKIVSIDTLSEADDLPMLRYVKQKLCLEDDGERLFFHPSMALLRMINILRGVPDRFLQAVNLEAGDIFLDATMGLASDTLIAAYAAGGKGSVIAVESSPLIHFLVQDGLDQVNHFKPAKKMSQEKTQAWTELSRAASRIETVWADHTRILEGLPDASVDVVYFDPMFRVTVKESSSIRPLKKWSDPNPLDKGTIREACRVARKRVVLKERKGSSEFARLNFCVEEKNKYSPVDFGIIDLARVGEGFQ